MVPAAFSTAKVLRRLNVANVGMALAAGTASVLALFEPTFGGFVSGLPTLVVGLLWAWVLRFPHKVGESSVRWGWVLSVPLAALNCALATGLLLGLGSSAGAFDTPGFLLGAALGGTFGIFVWAPALVATLVAFGLPIARAQTLAARGLAGEERGEKLVAAMCVLAAVVAFALGVVPAFRAATYDKARVDHISNIPAALAGAGVVFARVLAVLAAVLGSVAFVLARKRENARRAFVAAVAGGAVPGFRVDSTAEGKALVRVLTVGPAYRVSDFSEELYALDEEGAAVAPRTGHLLAAARPK